MSNEFYVYLLLDPRKFYLPFYVGKGKGNRCSHHLRKKYGSNTIKQRIVDKIYSVGLKPKIMIWKNNLTEQEAYDVEIELIKRFGKICNKSGILSNLTDGGEGLSGHTFSEEHKRKIGEAHRGKIVSEETREKQRIIAQNRPPISEETKKKKSDNIQKRIADGWISPLRGKKLSEDHRAKVIQTLQHGNATFQGRKHTEEAKKKISNVHKGKTGYCSKGNNNPHSNRSIYEFQNSEGLNFQGTTFDLSDEFNLRIDQIKQMTSGKAKSYKGWKILNIIWQDPNYG